MFKNIIPLVLALFVCSSLWAQVPREVLILPAKSDSRSSKVCETQDAGTIQFTGSDPANQSNDVSLLSVVDPIYLCWGDAFTVQHDQASAVFEGTPTAPGVGYAFYSCEPTNTGLTLMDVLADNCIIPSPANPTSPLVAIGDATGATVFSNGLNLGNKSLQDSFGMSRFWFAPITYDRLDTEVIYEDGDNSCVNVDITQAFSVVYLNEIKLSIDNISACGGTITVTGGLPEFNNSTYSDITIETVTGEKGSIAPVSHGMSMNFSVPQAGAYIISISDSKGCSMIQETVTITTADCSTSNGFTIEAACPSSDVFVGEQFCLDFTVSNFNNIVSTQFRTDWDPNILEFESVTVDDALTAIDFNASFLKFTVPGQLSLGGWVTTNFAEGSSLPDNTTLFTACFISKASGTPNFQILDLPEEFSPIEIIDINDNLVPLSTNICPSLTIQDPPPTGSLQLGIDIIKPCRGDANGKLDLSIAGGMPPYTIDITGTNTGYTNRFTLAGRDTILDGLAEDSYEYIILDADRTSTATSGFDGPISVQETDLVVRLAAEDPKCFGESSGQLTAVPLEFAAPVDDLSQYTFLWSTGDTDQVVDSLAPRVQYSVTVTDSNGCTDDDNTELGNPRRLEIDDITNTDATCSGTFDGALRATVTGGTGIKSYKWDFDTTRNTADLTGLDVGVYTLTVTDENNCTTIAVDSVDAAVELSFSSLLENDVNCFGQNDGSITVAPGITGRSVNINNYSYEWSANVNTPQDNGAVSMASDLPPDIYTVTIRNSDIPGCFTSMEFTIEEPEPLEVTIDITNVTKCLLPIPDGAASVEATGGTAPYTYAWDNIGDGIVTDASVARLDADSITIIVSDANGCMEPLDTIIGSPAPPSIVEFLDDAIPCADGPEKGSLQVLASPGDASVTDDYAWDGPTTISTSLSIAGNLNPGTYFVTVTDENDCSTVDSAEVVAPPAFDYSSFTITADPCFADSNGAFVLEIIGGTPGYDYAWEFEGEEVPNSTNTTSIKNAKPGLYALVGTDGNDCPIDTTINLTPLPEIVVTFSNLTPTSCALSDAPDGGATATASYAGGVLGDFDFLWTSTEEESATSQSTAIGLTSGRAGVYVKESNGICSTTKDIIIDSPEPIIYDDSNELIEDVSCFGNNDGAISTISAVSGGTPGYTLEWTHTPTGNSFVGETITDLAAGEYTLVVSDINDCQSAPVTKTIVEPTELIAAIDFSNNATRDVECAGMENGQITINATGGNEALGPYVYSWTNNVSFDAVASDLAPNITYEVTVSDARNCTATAFHLIQSPPDLDPFEMSFDDILCNGDFTNLIPNVTTFSGGNGGDYLYSVDGSPERSISEPSRQVRGGTIPIVIYDSAGCPYESTIDIPEPDPIFIEFPDAQADGANFLAEVPLGGEIDLNAKIFTDPSVPLADVMWSDTTVRCPAIGFCENGIVSPLDNNAYTITAMDVNGCETSATILIEVDKNRNVYIPNAFAPNSRGFDLNESFKIYTGLGVRSINYARVFNRWGTMVGDIGTISDPSPSGITVWDGQLKGQKLAQGVYVYIVSVTFQDNVTLLYRGDITLLR